MHLAQRASADREVRWRAQSRKHGVGKRGVIHREDAEGISHLVVDPGRGEIEFNVPGLLSGTWLIEARA